MTNFHVALGSKVPGGIDVDVDDMVPGQIGVFEPLWNASPALRYLVEYGLKQSLNDCIAAIKLTDADYTVDGTKAIVEKRLAAIMSGNVRSAGTREASDPILIEARKLARQSFNGRDDQTRKAAMTAFRKAGVTGDDKAVVTAIVERLAPQFKDEAARIVASRKNAVNVLADGLDDVLAGILETITGDPNDDSAAKALDAMHNLK